MKIAERGLDCAVDLDITMYHLERQSQAGSEQRWRMNLTLYNAWVHEGRWGARLRERATPLSMQDAPPEGGTEAGGAEPTRDPPRARKARPGDVSKVVRPR